VAAILFDEPLTVIDPHRKWLLRRKLKEIHKRFRHTLIYVTHDQTEALTFADEVVVMQTGEVLQRGTPEQLFLRPEHTYVGYFIGSPGMNVLPCTIERDGRGAWARIGEHPAALPDDVDPAFTGAGFELGIRPEHVALATGGAPGLPLAVSAVEDHGRFRIVAGKLGSHAIKLRLVDRAASPPVVAGQTVQITFPPERICLYRDGRIVAPAAPGGEAAPASSISAGAATGASAVTA